MKAKYLSNADFNFEKVNRASVACGPMVKWAIAQVRNTHISLGRLDQTFIISTELNTSVMLTSTLRR